MEPIGRSLQGVTGRPDFQKRLEQMKEKVMNDQDVQVFLKENEEIIDQKMIVGISLDSVNSEVHDSFRGRKGSFAQ
ncbi:hypothetical protein MOC06_25525, partial [Bacillus inaquosorum]|nr:hypothetical protein [Bacillus inaquosorum]